MALSSERTVDAAKPPLKIRARARTETAAGSTRHSRKINWRHSVGTPVAVAGHRENLGLVELLRRRCRFVICIDAFGDTPGSFTTLRQAAELARIEAACKIDLGPLDEVPATHALQPWTILRGTYTHADDDAADNELVILHVRPVIYQSLRDELVAFAAEDPDFPHYSTGNQFLSDTQFRHLVQYGREAMTASLTALGAQDRARLVAAADPDSAPPSRRGSSVDDLPNTRAASSKSSESRLRMAVRWLRRRPRGASAG